IMLHGCAHHGAGHERQRKQQGMKPIALARGRFRGGAGFAVTVFGVEGVRGRREILRGHDEPPRAAVYCSVCNSLPGLNRTAFPGGIETSAPVRGLRPIPVLRGFTLNTPKPRNSMRSPCSSALFMRSNTVSTAASAFVLVMPVRFTTSLMMSSLIKAGAPLRILR